MSYKTIALLLIKPFHITLRHHIDLLFGVSYYDFIGFSFTYEEKNSGCGDNNK
jgi:hypothetical protein